MGMSRREFVGLSLGVLALPHALAHSPVGQSTQAVWRTLYDPSCISAEQAAAQFSDYGRWHAVGSQLGSLEAAFLNQLHSAPALKINGVTTEAIPLQLQQLANHHGHHALMLRRFEGSTFVWQLQISQDSFALGSGHSL